MKVTSNTFASKLALSVLAACWGATLSAKAEDTFDRDLEKACGPASQMEGDPSPAQMEKYSKCLGDFFAAHAAKVQADFEKAQEQIKAGQTNARANSSSADPCPLVEFDQIDDFKLVSDFTEAIRSKRPKDARKHLAAELANRTKAGAEAQLLESGMPDLKGGLAATTDFGTGTQGTNRICRGTKAISHSVVGFTSSAMTPKLIAFDIIFENGQGRIVDIYPKSKSDTPTLDGIAPFQERRITETIRSLSEALEAGEMNAFMGQLSVERRFHYQPDISGENKLNTLFAPDKGKLSRAAFEKLRVEPVLTTKPSGPRLENGYPVVDVAGSIDTQPQTTQFKLKYVFDLGEWRLHDFKFDFVPVVGAALQPPSGSPKPPANKDGPAVRFSGPMKPHVITYKKTFSPDETVTRAASGDRILESETVGGAGAPSPFTTLSLIDFKARTNVTGVRFPSKSNTAPSEPTTQPLLFPEIMKQSLRYYSAKPTGELMVAGEKCTTYDLVADIDLLVKEKIVRIVSRAEFDKKPVHIDLDQPTAGPWTLVDDEGEVASARAGYATRQACITPDGLVLAFGPVADGFSRTAIKIERRAVTDKELSIAP